MNTENQPPTKEQVKAALDAERIKKTKKSFARRVLGNWGVRIVLIGILAVGVYEAYQHNMIPGIHQTEKNLIRACCTNPFHRPSD